MVVFPEKNRPCEYLAGPIMHPTHFLRLALLLAPAITLCQPGPMRTTAVAQDTPRPRGVTPQVDSQEEPIDPRLSIEFNRRYQDLRSGSPLSIDWTLQWSGERLPRGHLDVHIVQGRRIRGRLLSDREIVLTDVGTRFRTLLPPFNTDNDPSSPLDIRAFFISDTGVFPLGERSLRVAGPLRRSFVVAFCEPWQQANSPEELLLTSSLNAEALIQSPFKRSSGLPRQRLVATYPARIYPTDVPTDPLWLCEYNILVVLPDGLRALRRNQLTAISQWVDAGGNLCLFLDGPLSSPQAEFVNGLVRSTRQSPRPALDTDSMPQLTSNPTRLHKGLGRLVVHQDSPFTAEFQDSPDWQTSVSFLWNQLHELSPSTPRPIAGPQTVAIPSQERMPQVTGLNNEIKWQLNSVGTLVKRLTPDDFEVVPMWLLGLLLLGYVIVIGPVDYFVLGWLKLRKWTWFVFPLMTVAFTVLIVGVSHKYMGTTGNARSVVFRDIGDNSTLARENRFELHLAGTHTDLTTSIQHGLFTPIDHRRFLSNTPYDPTIQSHLDLGVAEPTEYIGSIPTGFTAVQDLPQWSPQVNRIFRIAPSDPLPQFDWETIEPEALSNASEKARNAFRDTVHRAFGPRSGAILFHGNHTARHLWNSRVPLFDGRSQSRLAPPQRLNVSGSNFSDSGKNVGFLEGSCVRPTVGIFRAVSRVAPHGGDNFEDLPLLDPTDPGQWLLVIAVAEGQSLVLYRHLYHDRPTLAQPPAPGAIGEASSTMSTVSR